MAKKLARPDKALSMIEMICSEEAQSICPHPERTQALLSRLYRLAHVGANRCKNKHPDWVKALEDTYRHMRKEKLL